MDELSLLNNFLDVSESSDFLQLIIRFLLNFVTVGVIIQFFYYPKSKRRDYYFTFTMIALSVFFLIFLLSSVKLKIGFALGIFAIFGIIRYRTESVPIREMTYLFTITAISVINALSVQISPLELIIANVIFILITWALESKKLWKKQLSYKRILYDKIDLITPDKYEDLLKDLSERTGLDVKKVEIEQIDFLRDAVIMKMYYHPVITGAYIDDSITPIENKNFKL
jgi:hypothetical protein